MWEASQGVHSSAGTRQLELNFVVVADAEASPTWIPFADGLADALDRLGAGLRKPRSQSRGGAMGRTSVSLGDTGPGPLISRSVASGARRDVRWRSMRAFVARSFARGRSSA